MLRLLSEAAFLTKWAFRFLLLASIGVLLHAYGQTRNTAGAYADDFQEALAALKELARALQ
jgi:cbb3-type cytochrome oxidase subunit 3